MTKGKEKDTFSSQKRKRGQKNPQYGKTIKRDGSHELQGRAENNIGNRTANPILREYAQQVKAEKKAARAEELRKSK